MGCLHVCKYRHIAGSIHASSPNAQENQEIYGLGAGTTCEPAVWLLNSAVQILLSRRIDNFPSILAVERT